MWCIRVLIKFVLFLSKKKKFMLFVEAKILKTMVIRRVKEKRFILLNKEWLKELMVHKKNIISIDIDSNFPILHTIMILN